MTLGKFFLFTIFATGTTLTVLYWRQDLLPFKLPRLPNPASIPQFNQLSRNQQLQSAAKQAQDQLQVTSEKFQAVSGNVQNVLGAAVQVNENETKTAPEKALDYGKYLYCKQVVEDYERVINSPAP